MEFFTFFKRRKQNDTKQEAPLLKPQIAVPTAAPTLSRPSAPPSAPRPQPSRQKVDIQDRHNRLNALDMTLDEADLDPEMVDVNKRQHQRINRGHILDSDIEAHCYNSRTGRRSIALLMDISPGGMLLLSDTPFQLGDEMLISCEIGNTFKMTEKAVPVRITKGRKYGMEFQSLSDESRKFITQLYGAVVMGGHLKPT